MRFPSHNFSKILSNRNEFLQTCSGVNIVAPDTFGQFRTSGFGARGSQTWNFFWNFLHVISGRILNIEIFTKIYIYSIRTAGRISTRDSSLEAHCQGLADIWVKLGFSRASWSWEGQMLVFREIKQHFDGEYNKIETFLNIQFLHSPRFRGQGIHFSQFLKATMSMWPRKPGSTSGFAGTWGYFRLGLMDFRNFFISYVFEVKESIFLQIFKATMSKSPQKNRSTSGFAGTRGYCQLGLMDFRNFFIPYVFEVKESIFCSFTRLAYSGDLENPGQLPVLQVLKGTVD